MVQNIGNVNNAITSNREMFTKLTSQNTIGNKQYFVNSYTTDKVQYYNDEVALKKEEKKKKNKKLTLAFVGLSGLATVGTVATQIIRGKLKPNNLIKAITESSTSKAAKDTVAKVMDTKAGRVTKSACDKGINLIINLCNIKDDLWSRYTNKIAPLKKANDSLENIYHGFSKNKYKKAYEESKEIIKKSGIPATIKEYDDWFDGMKNPIKDSLGLTNSKNKRITEGLLANKKGLPLKEKISKLWGELTGSVLSNDKINNVQEVLTKNNSWLPEGITIPENLYSKDQEKAGKALGELTEQIKKQLNKKEIDDEVKNVANAIKTMNKIRTEGSAELIERTRDTVLGNASTDVITTLIVPGLALGGALATADSKEERKSIGVNLGIPLLSGLGTTIYFTAKCYSGITGMALGLASGELIKLGVNKIDKLLNKKNKNEQEVDLNA